MAAAWWPTCSRPPLSLTCSHIFARLCLCDEDSTAPRLLLLLLLLCPIALAYLLLACLPPPSPTHTPPHPPTHTLPRHLHPHTYAHTHPTHTPTPHLPARSHPQLRGGPGGLCAHREAAVAAAFSSDLCALVTADKAGGLAFWAME